MSKEVGLNLPVVDLSNLPRKALRTAPGKVAFWFDQKPYTYETFATDVTRLSHDYRRHFQAGEVVALWMPNSPQLLCAYVAGFTSGVTSLPISIDARLPEVSAILKSSACRHLIVVGSRFDDLSSQALEGIGLAQLWTLDDGILTPVNVNENDVPEVSQEMTQPVPDDALGLILHTSGSTGKAKGVMLSRSSLQHIIAGRITCADMTADSVAVVASSLAHSVGLYQALAYLSVGATFVLLPSYETDELAKQVNQFLPTHLIMVVSAFEKLLIHPAINHSSFKNIRFSSVGADRVTATVQDKYAALTGRMLSVSYGMTELSWMLINQAPEHDQGLALGQPAPGVEIRLLDSHGQEVPEGQTGEIFARSRKQMMGYYNDPELTEEVITDGWVKSGDLAMRDGQGTYWFQGRTKDLIILHTGDTVSPVEVEQEILRIPGVSGCVVIGMQVSRSSQCSSSEVPWALVMRETRATPVATEILSYLGQRLSAYKIPERIIFVDHFPEGISGKVMRQQLRREMSSSMLSQTDRHLYPDMTHSFNDVEH